MQGRSIKETANRSLRAILSGKFGQAEVNDLVSACHALGVPYVRRRLNGDVVLRRTLELNVSDFTFDCVADLFAFSQSREFPHFHAYFAAYPPERLSEEEVLAHLRRLVFSQVNLGIFRLYNEVDPSLGKILRNIKLALPHFTSLTLIERFGEPCLVPSGCDPMLHQRSIEIEELETGLRRYLYGTENVPFMLGRLALYLRERSDVSRIVPLTSAGIVFRSIFAQPVEDEGGGQVSEEKVDLERLSRVVQQAVQKTREVVYEKYVVKKKIRPQLIDAYFNVIERRLNLTFSGDGDEKGLRDLLAEELGEISDKEYRSKHRSRLEYLSRLTGEEVARKLKQG